MIGINTNDDLLVAVFLPAAALIAAIFIARLLVICLRRRKP